MTRELWWSVFKAGVSLALLSFLLSRVELSQLAALLSQANPGLLTMAFGTTLLAWLLNTLKWRTLLAALGDYIPYRQLLALNFIGLFYSLVLPGQISGEVVKGFRLSQAGWPLGHVIVTLGLDRLTGLMALGLLGLAGLLAAPKVTASMTLLWVSSGLVLLGAAPLLFIARRPSVGGSLVPSTGVLGYARAGALKLWQDFAVYKNAKSSLMTALALALGFQSLVTLSNYLAAQAVGVDIAPLALLWIVAVVSLAHMAPIAFAGLGVREGAYVFFLHQYGIPLANGVSLSLAILGILLVQGMIGGAVEMLSPQPERSAPPAPTP